ncbi:MAG: type II toxin-antitoxin system VapC family toxin [Candidatus Xenobia bacterium]
MILLDTSGLLANYDRSDRYHEAVVRVMARRHPRILSPFVLAELDYLILKLAGVRGELEMLKDVAEHRLQLVPFNASDVERATSVIDKYEDVQIGLTDASIAVLADRHRCYEVLTLDQRHFRAMTSPEGKSFRLLPFDEQP